MNKIIVALIFAFSLNLFVLADGKAVSQTLIDKDIKAQQNTNNVSVIFSDFVPKETLNLNKSWKFKFNADSNASGGTFDDSSWSQVNIPHTWNAADGMNGGSNYARGKGWYRKTISLPQKYNGKSIYLEFEGANTITTLYVNGALVPYINYNGIAENSHKGGYSKFRYEITKYLAFGSDNAISACVDNSRDLTVAPLWADFTFYGGIYRDVSMLIVNDVQFEVLNYGSDGVFLSTEKIGDRLWKLNIKAQIKNNTNSLKTVTINSSVREPSEFTAIEQILQDITPFDESTMFGTNIVGSGCEQISIAQGEVYTYNTSINIKNPRLWNGRIDPYRYQIDLQIIEDQIVKDLVTDYVGFRTFEVTLNDGFILNGSEYPLRGVSRHQDMFEVGNAISINDQNVDFGMIYDIGATTIRLAHYPHSDYFYELCDKYGIVVWAEIPFITDIGGVGEYDSADETRLKFFKNVKEQLLEMIRGQYNHPSIMFWGLQNEVDRAYDSVMQKFMLELHNLAKLEDPTRLTTQATFHELGHNWKSDIIAWNFYPGWYGFEKEDFGTYMDMRHTNYPNMPIGISEYGAGGNPFQHEEVPTRPEPFGDDWHPEEYQTLVHESISRQITDRKYLWSTYIWNMFDFGSDSRAEGNDHGINDKGLVTKDRLIKKDSYYVYKALWSVIPFVHIQSSRFDTRYVGKINIKASSNCDSLDLYVNGIKTGNSIANDGYGQFSWNDVDIALGQNTITVKRNINNTVYEDTVIWTRQKSNITEIKSDILDINEKAKSIDLYSNVDISNLSNYIYSDYGASFTVYQADKITAVQRGILSVGMIVRVTAEDGITTADYEVRENNIAFGKSVTASTNQSAEYSSNMMTDGNLTTRWAAAYDGYPQYAIIDLEAVSHINKIKINFFKSSNQRIYGFKVYSSIDNLSYTLVSDNSSNSICGELEVSLGDIKARYIKLEIVSSSTGGFASVYEVKVYGWTFGSNIYDVDHENGIITASINAGQTITTSDFMKNLNLTGNYNSYSLNCGAFYISDGDTLTITDLNDKKHIYLICTGCGNKHTVNLSINSTLNSSSPDGQGNAQTTLKNIIDQDISTRWAAPQYKSPVDQSIYANYPEWISIDLGRVCNINRMDLYFFLHGQNNRAYRYEVLVSVDGSENSYLQIIDNKNNNDKSGHYDTILSSSVIARYIKVNITGCDVFDSGANISASAGINEITVYGSVCDENISSISLSKNSLYMGLNEIQKLSVTPIPNFSDITNKISWSSSDESVAVVKNGIITAVGVGSAKITAQVNGSSVSDICVVTINTKKKLSINKVISSSNQGQGSATVPSMANDGDIETRWQSANGAYPQYLQIDLGKLYSVEEFETYFFTYRPSGGDRYYGYEIHTSLDGKIYEKVIDNNSNQNYSGYVKNSLSKPVNARYVKLIINSASKGTAGVYEFTAFGSEVKIRDANICVDEGILLNSFIPSEIYNLEGMSYISSNPEILSVINNKIIGLKEGIAQILIYNNENIEYCSLNVNVLKYHILSLDAVINASNEGQNTDTSPQKAIDNDINTRWQSAQSTYPQYLVLDLGKRCIINEFETYFFTYRPSGGDRYYGYEIYVSDDGINYTLAVDNRGNNMQSGHIIDTLSKPIYARYVKLNIVSSSKGTAGVYEFYVYGRQSSLVEIGKLGDANGDEAITAFDALVILQHLAKVLTLKGDQLILANVDGQNSLTAYDASLILQFLAKISVDYEIGSSVHK